MIQEQPKDWRDELKEKWWKTFNDSGLPNYGEYKDMFSFIQKEISEAYTKGRSDEAKTCAGRSKIRRDEVRNSTLDQVIALVKAGAGINGRQDIIRDLESLRE